MGNVLKIKNGDTWQSILTIKGDTGAQGPTGPQGIQGPAGPNATYQTTAPTADATDGLVHIVYLETEPAVKYNGYLYLIKGE